MFVPSQESIVSDLFSEKHSTLNEKFLRLSMSTANNKNIEEKRHTVPGSKVNRSLHFQSNLKNEMEMHCIVHGSARTSVLRRLDTIHHSALRIIYGAFRTSPVTSLYVVWHQPPLELRRRQLSANYLFRVMSVPSHPSKPFSLATCLTRLYDARSFNSKPFSEREKAVLNETHLSNTNIQENNILTFPPCDIQNFNSSSPFSGYDKADNVDVIYH
ncbi:uncharacterized protein TNCV_4362611 [Trichonephila clavipes]|nr:uncharacterized protein TNCV_4362611 [Trichonephila clavipes]